MEQSKFVWKIRTTRQKFDDLQQGTCGIAKALLSKDLSRFQVVSDVRNKRFAACGNMLSSWMGLSVGCSR